MTEPIESDAGPAATEPVPPPPAEPTALIAPTPIDPTPTPTDPAPAPTSGWIAPEGGGSGGGRRRGCVIIAAVVGVLVVFAFLGLVFLGSQVHSLLGGTMEFGAGGSGCSVSGAATTFPASASIHAVAYLERKTVAGETITTVVTYPDATTGSTDQTFQSAADCVTEEIAPGLAPGHYAIEYRVGTESLAKGAFDITP